MCGPSGDCPPGGGNGARTSILPTGVSINCAVLSSSNADPISGRLAGNPDPAADVSARSTRTQMRTSLRPRPRVTRPASRSSGSGVGVRAECCQRAGNIRQIARTLNRKTDLRSAQQHFFALDGQRPHIIIDLKSKLSAGRASSNDTAVLVGADAVPRRCHDLCGRANDTANPCPVPDFKALKQESADIFRCPRRAMTGHTGRFEAYGRIVPDCRTPRIASVSLRHSAIPSSLCAHPRQTPVTASSLHRPMQGLMLLKKRALRDQRAVVFRSHRQASKVHSGDDAL